MKSTVLALSLIAGLLSSSAALALAADPESTDSRQVAADGYLERQADAAAFMQELNLTMDMARAGHLGSMTDVELAALEAAKLRIFSLLEGHEKSTDLKPDERIAVYNAQQLMIALIRRKPHEQEICKAIVPLGTRISSYECLSWERRDERERSGRYVTLRLQEMGLLCGGSVCQ
ncbi:MAG: hypothetical protein KDI48_17740 [Xanthomonadales bacterium]|nr:hypothetical protein [Xanthomonadales bacterium]